jgi:exopolysaccharide biosynthesis polyprenyl glycosylphosphotransferase
LKRIFDIVISASLLLFCLPLLLAAAIAIKFDSPGPILHRQVRVGRNGVEFTMFKFRSMRTDAERNGVPQWAAKRDNRITKVGAILRRLRIDEIPQVLNVLKGDMSMVGPRPERPFFVEQLSRDIRYYGERHRVKPGITGWAQVNFSYGASSDDAKEKLAYDLYYIKNFQLTLDLLVIIRTFQAVFWPMGVR